MKIYFIRHSVISDEIIPPIHFGYLASSLNVGHDIKIIDQLKNKLSDESIMSTIRIEKPEIVGLSGFTKDIFALKQLAKKIQTNSPQTKIIVGGIQMTLMPEDTFRYFGDYIDFGFVGESEFAFSQFIEKLNHGLNEINYSEQMNLIWRNGDEIRVNKTCYPKNLDEIPFPAWHLMNPGDYPKAPHGAFFRQFPVAPIITSRGCPYPCTFCAASSISGSKIRYRSMDNIFEEIHLLYNKFGVRELHIEDDNFSLKRERVVEFCERLLKEDLKITWAFPNGLRLNSLDIEELKLMNRAGCYALNVGVESGNDEVLKRIRKQITRETIKKKIEIVKEAGMDIGGFFIIGFPGETKKEMMDTINFTRELKLDRIGISYFQLYPGTPEYIKLTKEGKYHLDLNDSRHSLHTITYVTPGITEKTLRYVRLLGFIKFYFRPAIFLKILREARNFEHLVFILKRGIRWLTN